jgi:glutathione S-transferase
MAESKTEFKLMYHNGRGRGEVARTLFAIGGKFAPKDFEDFRFGSLQAFGAAQATGELGHCNLNRVPLLLHNGTTIGQGPAIARYIAKITGAMGTNDLEAAQIDMLCEAVAEIGAAVNKLGLVPYGNKMPADEQEAAYKQWFDTDAKSGRQLRWHLDHIEHLVGQLGTDGYSFGKTHSLADAMLYNKLGDETKLAEGAMASNGGPFANDKTRTDAVLKDFPKIAAIVSKFANHEHMKTYLAARTPQFF